MGEGRKVGTDIAYKAKVISLHELVGEGYKVGSLSEHMCECITE